MLHKIMLRVPAVLALVAAAAFPAAAHAGDEEETSAPVILVSFDGFRFDYIDRGITPNLSALAMHGVRAAAMRPGYPSKTMPNHYAIVTGFRPEHNGIVGNAMRDPDIPDKTYRMGSNSDEADTRWWSEAEPVWVTAEKQGVRTAPLFWPGSDQVVRGVRPSHYLAYDDDYPIDRKVDQIFEWMDLPAAERAQFYTLYFPDTDSAGHRFGPDAPETDFAIAEVDRQLGRLMAGLARRGIDANVIVLSDHGMAHVSQDRLIEIDPLVSRDAYTKVVEGAYLGVDPVAGHERELESALLGKHEHMECWRRENVPERLHYSDNDRIPAIICMPDTGWSIVPSARADGNASMGAHGYDNASPEMWATFVAAGPGFRAGTRLGVIDNVDVYPLLMQLLGLAPLANEGNPKIFAPALVGSGNAALQK